MASRTSRPPATGFHRAALYDQLLLFPERAEYLEQKRFGGYRIRLDHWGALAVEFRRAFEAVYERQSASILLVYGAQGTGKTLFTRKLEEDFARPAPPDVDNLWHVLAGGEPLNAELLASTRPSSGGSSRAPAGWTASERSPGKTPTRCGSSSSMMSTRTSSSASGRSCEKAERARQRELLAWLKGQQDAFSPPAKSPRGRRRGV